VEIADQFRRDEVYLQQNNRLDVSFRRPKETRLSGSSKMGIDLSLGGGRFNNFHAQNFDFSGPSQPHLPTFPFWNSSTHGLLRPDEKPSTQGNSPGLV
jgi:hypothetical protein